MEASRVRRIAVLAGLVGVILVMIGVTCLACVPADSRPCRSFSKAETGKTGSCRGAVRDRGKAIEVGLGLVIAVGSATFLITRLDDSGTDERDIDRVKRSGDLENSR